MYRMQNSSVVVDLLHPDLLSTPVLQALLRERKVDEKHINDTSREELLSLYSKVVLPLPQREPRHNRRGSFLLKKYSGSGQGKKSTPSQFTAKATSSSVPLIEPQRLKPPPVITNKTVGLQASAPPSRLKPPPISTESGKVIKLNSSRATNGDSIISSKRSMSPPRAPLDSKRPKLIRLNRTSLPQSSEEKDSPPPKKKHKPILWP